jgi:hypothetical protein
MTSTDEATIAGLIYTAIEALTPRKAYQSSTWSAYARKGERGREEPVNAGPKANSTRSRRFRLIWDAGDYLPGGIFTNTQVETIANLTVRVDYQGNADEQHTIEYVAIDDYHHVHDRLQQLKNSNTGVMLVESVRCGRAGPHEAADVTRYDLVYRVRYLRQTLEAFA